VAFSPDGTRIATGSNGREAVKLWDPESGQEVLTLEGSSSIFRVVSYAWAGLGAAFGPLMLFSLFWKRTTLAGAAAGMFAGGAMVVVWKNWISKLGGYFGIYELLPAFILSALAIFAVSLLTREPSDEIKEEFDLAKTGTL